MASNRDNTVVLTTLLNGEQAEKELRKLQDHARELEAKLIEKEVLVKSVYYDAKLTHEYQFNLSTINNDGRNYGMETHNELLLYLQSL